MGNPIPGQLTRLISTPAHSSLKSRSSRPIITCIARKVSDIKAYPDLDKDVAERKRYLDKKAAKEQYLLNKSRPRGFGSRPGFGIGPVGSIERTDLEREARHKYFEENVGPRELYRRMTFMLDGGKADLLLHTLRARYLERMHNRAMDQPVKMGREIPFVYRKLVDEILLCDKLYYADNPQPRIRDEEYDELVMHLLELERCFPELITPESPSQNVGHSAAVKSSKLGMHNDLSDEFMTAWESEMQTVPVTEGLFPQYRHHALMLSLDNAYRYEQLTSFSKRADEAGSRLSAELKIDGVALSLEYRRGELFAAATRGTGRVGDMVTDNVRASLIGRGVVERIKGDDVPALVIVRGEVYIRPKEFEELNKGLQRKLSNPRNAAAGALKHKNPLEAKARMLRFVGYECLSGDLDMVEEMERKVAHGRGSLNSAEPPEFQDAFATQTELFMRLSEWGFGEMPRRAVCNSITEAEAFANSVEECRKQLPFEIDGVVFKFEDSRARAEAGHTARAVKGAIAYKFTAQSKVTKLQDVAMQVSRNGIITPVALLEPVRVSGAVLSRATLHNFDEVERLGIAVGDMVRVQRGGDVIPKIVVVEQKNPSPNRRQLEPPVKCPSCQGEIVTEKDRTTGTNLVVCKNGESCHGQMLGRLLHFSSKDALDVRGLGKKTCEKLVRFGFVVGLGDLFRLTLDDLCGLEGLAEKSAQSLYDGIRAAALSTSLENVLFGLGLPGVGRTGARALALELRSLDKLLEISQDRSGVTALLAIPNFAEKSADVLFQYLRRDFVQSELKAIIEHVRPARVVNEVDFNPSAADEHPKIAGKSFVFTGKLTIMTRPALRKWVKSAGGIVMANVSHRTDYVVTGVDPGQKFYKAQRLKVRTLHEEEFLELFKPSKEDIKYLTSAEAKSVDDTTRPRSTFIDLSYSE